MRGAHLLRWYFRQAVFANMQRTGHGGPVVECDFPPDSNMMGEIMSRGTMAAERMEFELFSRMTVS